ncbi:MAG: putative quinol monooxygenase [Syntrophales bacterium]|nr:putative quinol monooxygenase [Syntrophales bacterium]
MANKIFELSIAIGRQFASTSLMIYVTIKMNVVSEKRLELLQTVALLSASIRMEKGCRRCDAYESFEDENRFFILEEWDTHENLTTHLKSKHFRVLRGAMNLLTKTSERSFDTAPHPEGNMGYLIVDRVIVPGVSAVRSKGNKS